MKISGAGVGLSNRVFLSGGQAGSGTQPEKLVTKH
jgi:hypothetical protein